MATIPEIISRWVDNDGSPLPFSRLYSYAAHSSVPKALYSDIDCTIPLSNPLVSDASGKFGQFFATSGRYKFALHSQTDDLIDTRDDIEASGNGSVGTVTSVQVTLGAALGAAQHVTTPPVTSAGNINMEFLPQSSRYVLIGPAGSTGLPTFRALEAADIPDLSGRYLPLAGGTMDDNATVYFSGDSGTSQINDIAVVFQHGQDYTYLAGNELWLTYPISVSEFSEAYLHSHELKLTIKEAGTANILRSITSDVSSGAQVTISSPVIDEWQSFFKVTSPANTVTLKASELMFTDTSNGQIQTICTGGTAVYTQWTNGSRNGSFSVANDGTSISSYSATTAERFLITDETGATSYIGTDFEIRNGKRLTCAGDATISGVLYGRRDRTLGYQLELGGQTTGQAGAMAFGRTSAGLGAVIGYTTATEANEFVFNNFGSNDTGYFSWITRTGNVQTEKMRLSNSGLLSVYGGGAISGDFTVQKTIAGETSLQTSSLAGSQATLRLQTGGVDRWLFRKSSAAESGSNAGSNIEFVALSDAGTLIDFPISIIRAAGGAITFTRPITANAQITMPSTVAQQRIANSGTGATLVQSVTIPNPGGIYEVTVATSLNNAGAYGVRTQSWLVNAFMAFPYTAYAPATQSIMDVATVMTGPAPTCSLTTAVNGVLTFTVGGTGTKKIDITVRKLCDQAAI